MATGIATTVPPHSALFVRTATPMHADSPRAHLALLGRCDLVLGDGTLVAVQPKRLALLAYLATAEPAGFHRRDKLLALFWPHLGTTEARRALRQALHYLRQLVGEAAIRTLPDDRIGLVGDALDTDVATVRRAAREGRPSDVVTAYTGAFLDGVFVPEASTAFDDWVAMLRGRLAATASEAAWRCVEAHEARGDLAAAVAAARTAYELAPDDEPGVRRLLGLLRRTSDRAGALRVYRAFEARLLQEYGGYPSSSTVQVVADLRRAPDAPAA